MNIGTGSGKTFVMRALFDYLGSDEVYILSARPKGYDTMSMLEYSGQKLILVDELQAGVHNDKVVWRREILSLLKRMTEQYPISMTFGSRHKTVVPRAKIIVTSNFPRPRQEDLNGNCPFARRYLEISSTDDFLLPGQEVEGPRTYEEMMALDGVEDVGTIDRFCQKSDTP